MTTLDNAVIDPAATIEIVRLLADCEGARPRLAMRGRSMLPLLHEPMVLVLRAPSRRYHVGDLIVFSRDGKLVAHRVTGLRHGFLETCGDALPLSPEYPETDSIVGEVAAVMASDAPDAVRIDRNAFRLCGLMLARSRKLRAAFLQARAFLKRLALALPWNRPRAYVALVQAMSASILARQEMLARAMASVEPQRLGAVAQRHGCSAMLVEAFTRMHVTTAHSSAIRDSLQATGRQVVLRSIAERSHLQAVIRHLQATGLPFALLKDAARLYADEPDATLHTSTDFDLLVRTADIDIMSAALRAVGYSYRANEEEQHHYREEHHHAAPLFPPAEGCAIELHHSLAPPRTLSIRLDWEALQPHLVWVQGACGRVVCLDRVGVALHLAVDSIGIPRLRDVVLLARLLARMDRHELDELRQIVASERIDPIRLSAVAALAARMARVAWPVSGSVEEYLRWHLRREDVPRYFSERSQLAEGWYAGDRRLGPIARRLLHSQSGLSSTIGAKPTVIANIGRVLTSIVAFGYISMMRPAS